MRDDRFDVLWSGGSTVDASHIELLLSNGKVMRQSMEPKRLQPGDTLTIHLKINHP